MKVFFAAFLIFGSSMALADQTQVVCANNVTVIRVGLEEYGNFASVVTRLNAKLKDLNVKSATQSTIHQSNGGNGDILTICVTVTR